MVIHCSHCGTALQRENARFCSHCGSFVESRSGVKAPFTPPVTRDFSSESAEEISPPEKVQEPPARNVDDETPTQPFAAISSLPTHDLSGSDNHRDALPFREERTAREERTLVSEEPGTIAVSEKPGIVPVSEEPGIIPVSEDPDIIPVSEEPGLNSASEEELGPIPVSEEPDLISVSKNMPARFTHSQDEVEQQDVRVSPVLSVPAHQEHVHLSDIPSTEGIVQSSPLLTLSGLVSKLRSRLGLWLAAFMVALIIVGGVSWLLILQLAPNTDPWQHFSDTNLGFSLLYPTDWQVRVDHKPSIVHFYDSTQTDKVDITVSDATAGNVAQFLRQQASQLGMTGVTSKPSLSFAGSSWQEVQGKLSQEGVSYSIALLATIHGNRLYLLTQIAPQGTYNDEEALVFSAMHAGLQFL